MSGVVLLKDEVEKDKIGFEFVEGPVTPKPEKLPGARKRKPKSGGPGWRRLEGAGVQGPAGQGVSGFNPENEKPACRETAGFLLGRVWWL